MGKGSYTATRERALLACRKAHVVQVHAMSRHSRKRKQRHVTVAKPQPPGLRVPGAKGLSIRSLFQRPGPLSVTARVGRLAVAVPLVLIGAAGVFMVLALPGTYGKSTSSVVGMNALTLLVSLAVAVFGAVICVNMVRAPRK